MKTPDGIKDIYLNAARGQKRALSVEAFIRLPGMIRLNGYGNYLVLNLSVTGF